MLDVEYRAQALRQRLGMAEVARHGDSNQDHDAVRPPALARPSEHLIHRS